MSSPYGSKKKLYKEKLTARDSTCLLASTRSSDGTLKHKKADRVRRHGNDARVSRGGCEVRNLSPFHNQVIPIQSNGLRIEGLGGEDELVPWGHGDTVEGDLKGGVGRNVQHQQRHSIAAPEAVHVRSEVAFSNKGATTRTRGFKDNVTHQIVKCQRNVVIWVGLVR